MKLSEITDKEHFINVLKDPKMAEVEKRLIEVIPVFKERGWDLTYELDQDRIAKQPIFRVEFTLTEPQEVEQPNFDPDSNRYLIDKLFPNIFQSSVINRRESKASVILYPHHESQGGVVK